jgi:hypothetical protein
VQPLKEAAMFISASLLPHDRKFFTKGFNVVLGEIGFTPLATVLEADIELLQFLKAIITTDDGGLFPSNPVDHQDLYATMSLDVHHLRFVCQARIVARAVGVFPISFAISQSMSLILETTHHAA